MQDSDSNKQPYTFDVASLGLPNAIVPPLSIEKLERHRLFWERGDVSTPLIIFTVGVGSDAWSYWAGNPGAAFLWNREEVLPEHIKPREFVDSQRAYLEQLVNLDDGFRAAIPFPAFPWMEAIVGCRIASTGTHFVSRSVLNSLEDYQRIKFDIENPWVQKYLEFLNVYQEAFQNTHPIGQSVIRGPSDLFTALLGAEKAIESVIINPILSRQILTDLAEVIDQFLRFQRKFIPPFLGGYVIGQYELWCPAMSQRIQQDNATLYSPKIYRDFFKPLDEKIAKAVPYTLFHLHSSALFLLEELLDIPGIAVFQVSRDEGHCRWEDILPQLQRIQNCGKNLVIKGRMSGDENTALKKWLHPCGLCIQPVVDSLEEAKKMLPKIRRW